MIQKKRSTIKKEANDGALDPKLSAEYFLIILCIFDNCKSIIRQEPFEINVMI